MKNSLRWLAVMLLLGVFSTPSLLAVTDGNPDGPPPVRHGKTAPSTDGNPDGPPPIVRHGPVI
jgi:hypothetical protein